MLVNVSYVGRSLTPINISKFERLDEWGHIIFHLEDPWKQSQPKVGRKLVLPEQLTNPLYGREELDQRLREMATAAPSIEQVLEITKRLPSLSKLLSEERDNE
ncbi:hypothetical protein HKBW3S42_02247 [Candidatus Hakubella thermalkaliphila]|uniref:Uncharacterized protein n=1 Tax=Candidatus Hakubella thermalkaliphila TaxID=2754717 RepID=A0A6V8PNT2_9ACTN|nr:hypothetical protein HKBW3S42_02247 [Candidatus Hakubella thermalkaliphila]